jgi:hypothetical protein
MVGAICSALCLVLTLFVLKEVRIHNLGPEHRLEYRPSTLKPQPSILNSMHCNLSARFGVQTPTPQTLVPQLNALMPYNGTERIEGSTHVSVC